MVADGVEGPLYDAAPEADRGLAFIAFQSSVKSQFEFLTQHWMNSALNPGRGNDVLVVLQGGERPGQGGVGEHPRPVHILAEPDDRRTAFDGDRFTPRAAWTRAEAATWLWHLAGSPTGAPVVAFRDVARNAPFHAALDWAVASGLALCRTVSSSHIATNMRRVASTSSP